MAALKLRKAYVIVWARDTLYYTFIFLEGLTERFLEVKSTF